MDDSGYSDYSDPRLQPPMEEEPKDGPLTEELRGILDRWGLAYEIGSAHVMHGDLSDAETMTATRDWNIVADEDDGALYLSVNDVGVTPRQAAEVMRILAS